MRKILQNYNEDDLLSKMLLLYFAFMHGSVGIFLIFEDIGALNSKTLDGMNLILPMDLWGLILLFSSSTFVLTVLQENKLEYWFMLASGMSGGLVFALLAMASLELSDYQTNTVNYIIIASVDAIVAVVGGVALWLRRT